MTKKTLHTMAVLLVLSVTMGFAKQTAAQSIRTIDQNEFSLNAGITKCVVFLEPIQRGEQISKASQPVCSSQKIETVNGQGLATSFLLMKFYQ